MHAVVVATITVPAAESATAVACCCYLINFLNAPLCTKCFSLGVTRSVTRVSSLYRDRVRARVKTEELDLISGRMTNIGHR